MTKEYLSDYVKGQERHPYSEPPTSLMQDIGAAIVGLMLGMLGGCGLALAIGVVYALFMISLEISLLVCVIYSVCVLIGGVLGVKTLS